MNDGYDLVRDVDARLHRMGGSNIASVGGSVDTPLLTETVFGSIITSDVSNENHGNGVHNYVVSSTVGVSGTIPVNSGVFGLVGGMDSGTFSGSYHAVVNASQVSNSSSNTSFPFGTNIAGSSMSVGNVSNDNGGLNMASTHDINIQNGTFNTSGWYGFTSSQVSTTDYDAIPNQTSPIVLSSCFTIIFSVSVTSKEVLIGLIDKIEAGGLMMKFLGSLLLSINPLML
ncbi:hypothetical protein Tco_0839459 [Tanacetum coccineum]|uniref:Uncharacterized protein n=1 Tax=Tanacetum coccineum TaxID=301880 RepID=A0ABQ5AT97_9ASTR